MNSNKSIILQSGAKLILNGATIQCSNTVNLWAGIVANGNSLIEQYTTFPDSKTKNSTPAWEGVLNGSQTFVELKNNTQIINATIGVKSVNGAIIRSRNSIYKNCEIGVSIEPYRSASKFKVNACFFMDDQFIWDNDIENISALNLSKLTGIKLNDVGTINIGGCLFENTNNTAHCMPERGRGIDADFSDFTVEKSGNKFCQTLDCPTNSEAAENCGGSTSGCIFNNLFKGIDYATHSGRNDQFIARYSSFSDNLTAIRSEKANAVGLYQNTFGSNRSTINNFYVTSGCADDYNSTTVIRDLEMDFSRQLRIVDNSFSGDAPYNDHIWVNGSNATGTSLIKKNSISSSTSGFDIADEVFGIILSNDNSTLNIICNTFTNQGVDIYNTVTSIMTNTPLSSYSTSEHAANSFPISRPSNSFNIYSDGTWNAYYRKGSGGFFPIGGTNVPSLLARTIDPNCNIQCSDFENLLSNQGANIKFDINHKFNVHPNPNNGKFSIGDVKILELFNHFLILNTLGQVLVHGETDGELDFSNILPNGYYILRLMNTEANQSVSVKIFINE